jgi:hypothetical protein
MIQDSFQQVRIERAAQPPIRRHNHESNPGTLTWCNKRIGRDIDRGTQVLEQLLHSPCVRAGRDDSSLGAPQLHSSDHFHCPGDLLRCPYTANSAAYVS